MTSHLGLVVHTAEAGLNGEVWCAGLVRSGVNSPLKLSTRSLLFLFFIFIYLCFAFDFHFSFLFPFTLPFIFMKRSEGGSMPKLPLLPD